MNLYILTQSQQTKKKAILPSEVGFSVLDTCEAVQIHTERILMTLFLFTDIFIALHPSESLINITKSKEHQKNVPRMYCRSPTIRWMKTSLYYAQSHSSGTVF